MHLGESIAEKTLNYNKGDVKPIQQANNLGESIAEKTLVSYKGDVKTHTTNKQSR